MSWAALLLASALLIGGDCTATGQGRADGCGAAASVDGVRCE